MQKRQAGGLDISALLGGNPSSAIAEISGLLTNPAFASVFTSLTADPAFQTSVSQLLVSEVGSSSAALAFGQYSSVLGELAPIASSALSASATATATSSAGGSESTASSSAAAGGESSSSAPAAGQSSSSGGTQPNSSSSNMVITALGSAICLSTASFLLFVM